MLQRDVVKGVHRVSEHYVNWYIVEDEGQLTVVDAGLPASWDSLIRALDTLGRPQEAVEALVLTHAHFDHIGFVERARLELGVPVLVHENDVPLTRRPWLYVSERSPLFYLGSRTLPILISFVQAGAPRTKPIREVRRFSEGETLDVPGSPKVVFTSGHTLEHCALHLPDRDVVISGDALVTHDPYTDACGRPAGIPGGHGRRRPGAGLARTPGGDRRPGPPSRTRRTLVWRRGASVRGSATGGRFLAKQATVQADGGDYGLYNPKTRR